MSLDRGTGDRVLGPLSTVTTEQGGLTQGHQLWCPGEQVRGVWEEGGTRAYITAGMRLPAGSCT